MKVYIVTGFKTDYSKGYSLPVSMEVYSTREAAEKAAEAMECFATVTTKEVHG